MVWLNTNSCDLRLEKKKKEMKRNTSFGTVQDWVADCPHAC
jgi:hypothetical protein